MPTFRQRLKICPTKSAQTVERPTKSAQIVDHWVRTACVSGRPAYTTWAANPNLQDCPIKIVNTAEQAPFLMGSKGNALQDHAKKLLKPWNTNGAINETRLSPNSRVPGHQGTNNSNMLNDLRTFTNWRGQLGQGARVSARVLPPRQPKRLPPLLSMRGVKERTISRTARSDPA